MAVGILFDKHERILVGQRTGRDQYFGQWEFPGGKIEAGESVEQALVREFEEEVAVRVIESSEFLNWQHDYPDRFVNLFVRFIRAYEGAPSAQEGQAIKFVSARDLTNLNFLQGNKAIIDALQDHLASNEI
ncbi:MAG: 8-oxo-dGTP diphosphatase MutT [Pseudomonadota bacterium]